MFEERLIAFIKRNRGAVIGALIGLILVIMFFTLGFWKTILGLLIIFLCAFIGNIISKSGSGGVMRFLDKIFK